MTCAKYYHRRIDSENREIIPNTEDHATNKICVRKMFCGFYEIPLGEDKIK